jgi:hypothetical protein
MTRLMLQGMCIRYQYMNFYLNTIYVQLQIRYRVRELIKVGESVNAKYNISKIYKPLAPCCQMAQYNAEHLVNAQLLQL